MIENEVVLLETVIFNKLVVINFKVKVPLQKRQ